MSVKVTPIIEIEGMNCLDDIPSGSFFIHYNQLWVADSNNGATCVSDSTLDSCDCSLNGETMVTPVDVEIKWKKQS